MAETAALIISDRADGPEPESDSALFHRRIEFHQARKNFSGFVHESSNGFKLVTLNPSSDPVKPTGFGNKTDKSSELSQAGLDPELSFEITFRRIVSSAMMRSKYCHLDLLTFHDQF